MSEVCGDNRFELIGEFKGKLVEGTNIETSPEEMAVLDNILFRFWQMGWLDKLKAQEQKCRECGEATSKAIQELQAKLEAQEPRVMTPVEVMLAESVWLEDIDKEKVIHGLRCSSGGGKNWFVVSSMEAVSAMDADYGVRWRCWTSRPDQATREAVKWDGTNA